MTHNARNTIPATHFGVASRYRNPATGEEYAKVFPGKLYGTTETLMLVTLLGSCVSACIRDPMAGIGGMNHFMLPGGQPSKLDPKADHRHGQSAMDTLIAALERRGALRERMEVKLFGGGIMLERSAGNSVGERNIEFVRSYCQERDLRIAASDLGRDCARKIIYNPSSGIVQVKRVVESETPIGRNMGAAYG